MSDKQSQRYLGNGNHKWEVVYQNPMIFTQRLRVPGGWLYSVSVADVVGDEPKVRASTTFVPMPEVVSHKV